jgi:hypothetical protein
VYNFTVDLYPTIAAGGQPDVAHPPLAHYELGSDAGETPAGLVAGVPTYNYAFVLPTPFQAAAGTKYWVQIEAWQYGTADWGLARATGGNGSHFEKVRTDSGLIYRSNSGDAALMLLAPGGLHSTATQAAGATSAPYRTATPTKHWSWRFQATAALLHGALFPEERRHLLTASEA